MRARRNRQEPNYWAAYADCMLALFMIALLLWLLSSGKTIFSNIDQNGNLTTIVENLTNTVENLEEELKEKDELIGKLEKIIKDLPEGDELVKLVEENDKLRSENEILQMQLEEAAVEKELLAKRNESLAKRNEELDAEISKLNQEITELKERIGELQGQLSDKPPIIELDEGNPLFSFDPGSASLNVAFRQQLKEKTFPELLKTLEKFPKVDTIEIIGHTDGVGFSRKGSMDDLLPDILHNGVPLDRLTPGSNADLGLMRALAIRDEWNKWLELISSSSSKLPKPAVRCYSAAQTIPANGEAGIKLLTEKVTDPASRRIEIRVTDLMD